MIAGVWKRGCGLEVLAKASDAPDVQALAPQMHAKSCRVYRLRLKAGGLVWGILIVRYLRIWEERNSRPLYKPPQKTQSSKICSVWLVVPNTRVEGYGPWLWDQNLRVHTLSDTENPKVSPPRTLPEKCHRA